MSDSRALRRQIEAVLDESSGEEAQVIVRMRDPNPRADDVVPAMADAIRRRALSISARELLPPNHDAVGRASEKPRGRAKKQLADSPTSLLGQIALQVVLEIGAAALKKAGLGALEPLLSSQLVKESLGQVAGEITQLWASSSAVLTLTRDALSKLDREVQGIGDIYPNRRLFVPPVVAQQAQQPAVVRDNQAATWGLRKIGALSTWGAYEKRGEDTLVAVLDTGVDPNHPDLAGKVKHWAEFDDGGRPVSGSTAHDTDQHGTHCAGIICGGKTSGRWIGVAPASQLAVALCLDGEKGGTDAQILAGLQWAIELGVDVISMSLGGLTMGPDVPPTYSVMIQNALRVGIPVVTAIGNSGNQTTGSPGNDFFSFAIGATDVNDRPAGFSGGRTHVIRDSKFIPPKFLPLAYSKPDISAPGVEIYSSVPAAKNAAEDDPKRWATFNGTSMATPHVAGAIALLLSATAMRKTVDRANLAFLIQDLLTGSVEELGEAGQDHRYGFGRLDVLRAIGFALERGY